MTKQKEPIVVAQIMGKMKTGGVEAVIMNYYRHIDRTKIQFDFICDSDSTNIPKEEIERLGGRVILVPPYQKLPQYLKALKKIFKESKYKIVHSNINTLSVFPLYAAKKAGVPVRIAHSHNTSNPTEKKRNILKNILRKFSKVYATDYFACSELAGRYQFGDKAFNNNEVKIINNAIDLEKYKFNPEARKQIRKELNIPEDAFVMGHVGNFRSQKNHTQLIDIFNNFHKKNPNSYLMLIGRRSDTDKEVEAKIKEYELDKFVFILDNLETAEKHYSAFDAFVMPSLYEGLPVVGVESQANGLKVFFSDRITEEAKILPETEFLSLDEDWTKKISSDTTRSKNTKKSFTEKNLNIETEAEKLLNAYLEELC